MRAISSVDSACLADIEASRHLCQDLRRVSATWLGGLPGCIAEVTLAIRRGIAEERVGREIADYWGGDKGLNQLVAYAFAHEELWPMRQGTSMTWGATYLRAWRRDRLERMQAIVPSLMLRTRVSQSRAR